MPAAHRQGAIRVTANPCSNFHTKIDAHLCPAYRT
jgi:hypothetical protein